MEERYEKLIDLLKREEVIKTLAGLSPEEVTDFLQNEYGLVFTIDEVEMIAKGMKEAINDNVSDELSEEILETVSGGGKDSIPYKVGYYAGKVVKAIKAVGSLVLELGW